MAKRLSVKHRKLRRDKQTAYAAGDLPRKHKVAKARSRRARLRNANPMV